MTSKRNAILSIFAFTFVVATPLRAQVANSAGPTIADATLGEMGQRTREISTTELRTILSANSATVLDARPHLEFAISHIPGAVNVAAKSGVEAAMYVSDVAEVGRLVKGDKAAALVLYCNGPNCGKSKRLADDLLAAGYTNVRRYQLGLPVWRALGGVAEIEPEGLRYVLANDRTAVVIDARDTAAFRAGTLPNARQIARSGVLEGKDVGEVRRAKDDGRLPMNDHDTRIIVIGANAADARYVAEALAREAFYNVTYFRGTAAEAMSAIHASSQAPSTGSPPEHLTTDTPKSTVGGTTFVAPANWNVSVRGIATILEPPEGDSHIALVDVSAPSADSAVALAWAAYMPQHKWPLKVVTPEPDKEGWSNGQSYTYQTSPDEKRGVGALARRANGVWTVVIYDMSDATGEKRGAAVATVYSRLLPKGYVRESFTGKKAATLDAARLARISAFVENAMRELKVPGVAVGIIQNGKVVFADGFGVRELGKPEKPDANTLFMIASNTKALTTLMLAKLVDAKRFSWETPVTSLMPSFKLGDSATTRQVLVKHLICACTGLPRQDLEWLLEFKNSNPESVLRTLGTMHPTSKFGEMFQYSNLMAAAAGYIGAHVAYPTLELGAAYDQAMKTLVFQPLGMTSTTFDYSKALAGNHASPHSEDVDGNSAVIPMDINYSIVYARPAGAAWSNVHDLLKYVAMELANGKRPDGTQYISTQSLLTRRQPQVPIGTDATYGMGLIVNNKYGTPVVHHGGDMFGFHSDMMWWPEHNVGAVVLTNADPGWTLRDVFRRKLLEVMFDGRDEADASVASDAKSYYAQVAADRKLLTLPADPAESSKLASHYHNDALGDIDVRREGGRTHFDFGEWRSEVATRKNPDGSISFITTDAGVEGFEFVVGKGSDKNLTIRDAQHEYVFNGS